MQRRHVGGKQRRVEGQRVQLLGRGLNDARIPMSKRVDEHTGEAVDVPAALFVAHTDAIAFGEDQRVLPESLHLDEVDHQQVSQRVQAFHVVILLRD